MTLTFQHFGGRPVGFSNDMEDLAALNRDTKLDRCMNPHTSTKHKTSPITILQLCCGLQAHSSSSPTHTRTTITTARHARSQTVPLHVPTPNICNPRRCLSSYHAERLQTAWRRRQQPVTHSPLAATGALPSRLKPKQQT
eukprot:1536659-Amphidinium_carterae.1